MKQTLDEKCVADVMTTSVATVQQSDSMQSVARIFDDQGIHAAPVVSPTGECVGILTSRDLAAYESRRAEVAQQVDHGKIFNDAHYGDGPPQFPLMHFDEAGFQMTAPIAIVDRQASLADAARKMCQFHTHHLVILDAHRRPEGIISTLDILSQLVQVPVGPVDRCGGQE